MIVACRGGALDLVKGLRNRHRLQQFWKRTRSERLLLWLAVHFEKPLFLVSLRSGNISADTESLILLSRLTFHTLISDL